MSDRPILFSASMVQALLAGTKTQTRRLLNPQPSAECHGFQKVFSEPPYFESLDGAGKPIYAFPVKDGVMPYPRIRFGIGDRLYVRETWRYESGGAIYDAAGGQEDYIEPGFQYRADHRNPARGWKPGIHMPLRASRLTLTVTDVRVERLNDCSEADALAEGVVWSPMGYVVPGVEHPNKDFPVLSRGTAREMYAALWDVINGSGAWLANPWVVVVCFRPERRNIDA